MGCWNGTDAISNLHIYERQDVVVFMLAENKNKSSFCETTALYDVCPIFFEGKYNGYGSIEEEHGFGLTVVMDAIKEQLYEFGEGPNSSHDVAVNKSNFDFELMMSADHEGRLAIENRSSWNEDEYHKDTLERNRTERGLTRSQEFELDRLVNKIKAKDMHRQLNHVIIHKQVFDNILEKFYIEKYVGNSKGTAGYDNNYNHIYFKDVIDSIPEYIQSKKETASKIKDSSDKWAFELLERTKDTSNLAQIYLKRFDSNTDGYAIIDVSDYIYEYVEHEEWDNLYKFVKVALTGYWINMYMESIRKVWSKQCGDGSQNTDPMGYRILANSINEILDKEKEEYGNDE